MVKIICPKPQSKFYKNWVTGGTEKVAEMNVQIHQNIYSRPENRRSLLFLQQTPFHISLIFTYSLTSIPCSTKYFFTKEINSLAISNCF